VCCCSDLCSIIAWSMYEFRLTRIRFDDESTLEPANLTVVIGPNNVGKSRMLREITDKVTNSQPPDSVVVRETDWTTAESLDIFRQRYPTVERYKDKTGRWIFRLIAPDLCNEHRVQGGDWPGSFTHYFPSDHPDKKRGFAGHFGPSLTAFLNTENRLLLLKESPSAAEEKQTENLLQMLYNMVRR
jgi:hypothetical protein